MVKFVGSQQDFMKIPVLGIVPESSSTAPSSPATGQLWNDTANNVLKRWDGSAWVAVGSSVNIDTDGTLASNSDAKVASQRAVKTYVDGIVAANDAMVFKGVIDCSANPNYPAANRGDTYRVSVAGKIGGASGVNVEAGDLIICLTDGTAAGNQATVGSAWTIVQTNLDGAVTGPSSSTSGNLASFNSTSGKVVADSGVAPDTDGTLAANSDAKIPTQKAVKTYAQPVDATLTALAGVTTAADKMIYATGVDTFSTTTVSSFARTYLDDTTAAGMRSTIGATSVFGGATIGALVAGTPTTVTHGLGTFNVVVSFRITATDDPIDLAWKPTSGNAIAVTSDVAFASGAITITIVG